MTMKRLDLKLLRDCWALKTQALAIALVMASGTATLILSLSTVDSLRSAQFEYYDRYQFADVFAHVKRAPDAMAAMREGERNRELQPIRNVRSGATRPLEYPPSSSGVRYCRAF